MDIEKALKLKKGDSVFFPPDRGDAGGIGMVKSASKEVNKNIHGKEYVWVGLMGGGVWPSNRLK